MRELLCLVAIAVMGVSIMGASNNQIMSNTEETIRDASGKKMGTIKNGTVYNASGQILGFFDNNGTYDHNRRKISQNQIPGILFCKN